MVEVDHREWGERHLTDLLVQAHASHDLPRLGALTAEDPLTAGVRRCGGCLAGGERSQRQAHSDRDDS
jgi:hypothetical protein